MIYEGTPDYPGPDRLWALVERHGVTLLGISPTVVRSLMAHGDEPVRTPRSEQAARLRLDRRAVELGALALVLRGRRRRAAARSSTTPAAPRSPAASSAAPPSRRSSPAPSPGRCRAWPPTWWTTQGNPVRGQVGELVIRQPWPGMTRGFWQDPHRYEDAYWARFPGIWVHGDWAAIDGDGFWYILGRSDDTIKVAGKRLGPAEVESAAVAHPAVMEAAAIGVPARAQGRGGGRLRRRCARRRADGRAARRDPRRGDARRSARRSSPTRCSSSHNCPRRATARCCAG